MQEDTHTYTVHTALLHHQTDTQSLPRALKKANVSTFFILLHHSLLCMKHTAGVWINARDIPSLQSNLFR